MNAELKDIDTQLNGRLEMKKSILQQLDDLASMIPAIAPRVENLKISFQAYDDNFFSLTNQPGRIAMQANAISKLNDDAQAQDMAAVLCQIDELKQHTAAARLTPHEGEIISQLTQREINSFFTYNGNKDDARAAFQKLWIMHQGITPARMLVRMNKIASKLRVTSLYRLFYFFCRRIRWGLPNV